IPVTAAPSSLGIDAVIFFAYQFLTLIASVTNGFERLPSSITICFESRIVTAACIPCLERYSFHEKSPGFTLSIGSKSLALMKILSPYEGGFQEVSPNGLRCVTIALPDAR